MTSRREPSGKKSGRCGTTLKGSPKNHFFSYLFLGNPRELFPTFHLQLLGFGQIAKKSHIKAERPLPKERRLYFRNGQGWVTARQQLA